MSKIFKVFRISMRSISHPSQLKILFRDLFKKRSLIKHDDIHLKAVMDWIQTSQEVTHNNGSAGIYSFEKGWSSAYPETTGYIIPTLLDYASYSGNTTFISRAKELGDWEISIQLPNGAVRGGIGINSYPIVFNTGQVIFGWVSLYIQTKDNKYLKAAVKASEWLVSIQDEDGKWSKYVYNNIPHAHNIRVAWALLEVYNLTKIERFKSAAKNNILWLLSQTKDNGWIEYMGFTKNENPFTHTIAYTLRGLWECSRYFNNELKDKIQNNVKYICNIIIKYFSDIDLLPGAFRKDWTPIRSFSCLTGNAQIAIILLKLFQTTKDKTYLNIALRLIDQLKSLQDLSTKNKGIYGGIAGSHPIWGKYSPFTYPNWAAKFFADSIILKKQILLSLNNKSN